MLIFDIETNGLLSTLTCIHSLVIYNTDTNELISCSDHNNYIPIREGLELLSKAECIIGHNIQTFDIPAIQKLYPDWTYTGKVRDTLTMARLIFPEVLLVDFGLNKNEQVIPNDLIGKHSLEAWGYRLKIFKGEYGKTSTWDEWSEDMQSYCEQDVRVTIALWDKLMSKNPSERSLELEHAFQNVIFKQEQFGFGFDVEKAEELYKALSIRRAELHHQLQTLFPPLEQAITFIPKASNKTRGYVKGVPFTKITYKEFNPGSRIQIAERLKPMYNWKPLIFTDKGQPEVSEEVLSELHWPEAKLLTEYLMLEKRIGQLAEGKAAWLLLQQDGRIHGRVITNGAVTGRCTHLSPNIAQVPAVDVPFGHECRALFNPSMAGYVQLGCDASGLELRCLAHYMANYDGGEYAKVILEGDIHTVNQKAAGLPTRNDAKTFIYAFLYGAGSVKLGSILLPHATKAQQTSAGKRVRTKFLKALPALEKLIKAVQSRADERKYLIGLDGRHLHIRSLHSALNTLLQSTGAIIMKQATVILWQDLEARGYTFGKEVAQLAHIHDEYQLAVREGLEAEVGEIAVNAIKKAGIYFGFRCPLDGEYKVGRNWAETH